jgi:hypothetical protein
LINLHFARFEFKYILPKQCREDIEKELQYFMEPDPFVKNKPRKCYEVRSLYFDDADRSCYNDKINGLHTRYKFRLRTYTTCRNDFVSGFLELKGRFNELVFKHRTPFVLNKEATALKGNPLALKILESAEKTQVAHQFHYELHRKRIAPTILVDYSRKPYISKYDPEFRLTFDENLRATATSSLFPDNPSTRAILRGCTIVEIKFHSKLPAWFHHIIQAYELQRVSISKMCKGVEACECPLDICHS